MQELELVTYLLYEKEESGMIWIKFNRPERMNAAMGGTERKDHRDIQFRHNLGVPSALE
jgi:hypothetical protein